MKKKSTNQATKHHAGLFTETGAKSKAAPNFNGRGSEPVGKYPDSEIQSKKPEQEAIIPRIDDQMAEMKQREFVSREDPEDSYTMAIGKELQKKKYEAKDKDLKNALDKSTLEKKVKYYQERENKMGGSKAVSKKIKRKEFARKAAGPTALTLIGGGLGKMAYDIIQQNKKRNAE
ncbi:MAG: hypothetical protein RLZZ196_1102 [Bacteroidota bacterium]|jgi:hypothetical protein